MKKITLYAIQNKYKNQAGMNLTPTPPTSQNSQIIIIIIFYTPDSKDPRG